MQSLCIFMYLNVCLCACLGIHVYNFLGLRARCLLSESGVLLYPIPGKKNIWILFLWLHIISSVMVRPLSYQLFHYFTILPKNLTTCVFSPAGLPGFRHRCFYLWNSFEHSFFIYHPAASVNRDQDLGECSTDGYLFLDTITVYTPNSYH